MKRSRLGPGRKSLERGSTFVSRGNGLKRRAPGHATPRRDPAPTNPSRHESEKATWGATARTRPCAVCGSRTLVQGHHVIYAQHLKREGLRGFLWDLRNQLSLCAVCHARHHQAVARVPRDLLTVNNHEFAAELGLSWLLRREYPVRKRAL